MSGIQSIQSFNGTIICPGRIKHPNKKSLESGNYEIRTENVSAIINDVQHLDTRVVFKDGSPDLFVRHTVIPTKEIVNAYAAAKDSDLVISL